VSGSSGHLVSKCHWRLHWLCHTAVTYSNMKSHDSWQELGAPAIPDTTCKRGWTSGGWHVGIRFLAVRSTASQPHLCYCKRQLRRATPKSFWC